MRLEDVRLLRVEELEAVVEEWNKRETALYRDRWERMRMLATITVQPHTTKRVTPRQLLPLPWDAETPAEEVLTTEAPRLSKEEQLRRFESLMKRR